MILSLKPVGAACNMACRYCYYLEKGAGPRMTDETFALAARRYAEATPPDGELHFLWHGGEPLLMPLDFYRRAMATAERYAAGRPVHHYLQTNGTLLTDEWCRFLAQNHWLTGISIDGDAAMHDVLRRHADGRDTHSEVLKGIERLNRAGAEWNAMATVNSANADRPEEFYDFFKTLGCRYLQFTPIVERRTVGGRLAENSDEGVMTPESVTPAQWGRFLCRIFDRWSAGDVGKVFVRIFDDTLALMLGAQPGSCVSARQCGGNPMVEANGDIYVCDHFVFPDRRLGNIATTGFAELAGAMQEFGLQKAQLPAECRNCRYVYLCNGECPKNRFGDGPSYLCEGYKAYFRHVEPWMRRAAEAISVRLRQN